MFLFFLCSRNSMPNSHLPELEKKDRQEEDLLKQLLRDLSILRHKMLAAGVTRRTSSQQGDLDSTRSIDSSDRLPDDSRNPSDFGPQSSADIEGEQPREGLLPPQQGVAVGAEGGEGEEAEEDFGDDFEDEEEVNLRLMTGNELAVFLEAIQRSSGPKERRGNWPCGFVLVIS
jgi:hypothetical protein